MGPRGDRGVFKGLNGRECIDRSIVLKTKERETEPMLILMDDYK